MLSGYSTIRLDNTCATTSMRVLLPSCSGVVPTVDGVVSQTRRSGGAQYVEVTIGADDGLKTGNTLEVFRGDRYLGRLDIVSTSPDKSVGKVDRRYQQGQIQEGDRVATRLKL